MDVEAGDGKNCASAKNDVSIDVESSDSQIFNDNPVFNTNILHLPWEQVLCRNILPHLNIPQLFKLRRVSQDFFALIDTYFSLQFDVNVAAFAKRLTPQAFSLLTKDSHCLKTLNLRGAKHGITNDVLLPILSNNPRLETINISGCTSLSGCVLYAIGVNCPKIKQLMLRDCVSFVEENFLSFLFMEQPIMLEYLDLSGCWNMGDEVLVKLVQKCSNLKHVMVGNLFGLTDRAVCAIAHSCPELISLSLVGCWRVTNNSISLIGAYCLKLKLLHVKECRDITEASLGPLRKRQVKIDKSAPPVSFLNRLEFRDGAQRINVML